MSLPRDLLDQLLSGYLDDALSTDERARVEQLLQTDDEIVAELAQLRELRQSLKALSQEDAASQLDGGFADRVLGAAVARAHAEGLGEDHPLVRLSEKPSKSASSGNASPWRYAGILVGLAASIVFAVIALRPETQDPQSNLISVADLSTTTPVDPTIVPEPEPTDLIPEKAPVIASTEVKPEPKPTVTPAELPKAEPKTTAIAKADTPVEASPNDSVQTPGTMIEIPASSKLAAVLVVNVKLTSAGHDSGAMGKAMQLAGLRPANQKAVTDEIASAVGDSENSKDNATVLFLQAPAKKLDQLYLHLLADTAGVKSVGLTISMDAPIVSVADALRPDPRLVQHSDSAIELLGGNGTVSQLAHELGVLNFAPANTDLLQAMVGGGNDDNGPDVPAQVLVLVH
jgi:anti-sigma factor RsiW